MTNRHAFPDGSSLTWVDKETLRYEEGSRYVLAWVDFSKGFFSRKRVLKVESLKAWASSESGVGAAISPEKVEEIIEKVRAYYGPKGLDVE